MLRSCSGRTPNTSVSHWLILRPSPYRSSKIIFDANVKLFMRQSRCVFLRVTAFHPAPLNPYRMTFMTALSTRTMRPIPMGR